MQLTVFSFLMAVIWSSVIILLSFIFRKRNFFIKQFGVSSLALLYLFCIIRMILPIEFSFTQVIPLGQVYNPIYDTWSQDISMTSTTNITLGALLISLWLAVFAGLMLYFIIGYHQYVKQFSHLKTVGRENADLILERIKSKHKRKLKVCVIFSDAVDSPLGLGILKKRILLPNETYPDDQLYNIILHEYTHFLNRDLTVKMLVQVFCCIFWWNPLAYLLQKDLEQVLEIKCDLTVIENMEKPERVSYLTTILSVLKKALETKSKKKPGIVVLLFDRKKKNTIEERFEHVLSAPGKRGRNKFTWAATLVVFVFIAVLSYTFIFQSQYNPPVSDVLTSADAIESDPKDITVVKGEDGKYYFVHADGRDSAPLQHFEELREMLEESGIKIIEGESGE